MSWSVRGLIAPDGQVGTVGGIMNFSSQISGIAAPIITGYAFTSRHSFALAFSIAAGYLLAGLAGYAFLLGKIVAVRQSLNGPDYRS